MSTARIVIDYDPNINDWRQTQYNDDGDMLTRRPIVGDRMLRALCMTDLPIDVIIDTREGQPDRLPGGDGVYGWASIINAHNIRVRAL